MSLLNNVTRGKIRKPHLVLPYGPDSTGKTTFAAEAPKPIFLATEAGSDNHDVSRLPIPKSFKDVLDSIDALIRDKHDYETLVVDSLDWLEPLVFEQVCFDHNEKSIESLPFGKGYVFAIKHWQNMMAKLTRLREERRMNIVLIAHSQIRLAKDPQLQAEYDRYQLKLNDKAAALWREFVDSVLFINFETFTRTDKSGKTKAFGENKRIMHTVRSPGFDAKTRFNIPDQIEMVLGHSWESYAQAVAESTGPSVAQLYAEAKELVTQLPDTEIRAKTDATVDQMKENTQALETIITRLKKALTPAA